LAIFRAIHLRKPMASRAADMAATPTKARAASQASMREAAASLRVTVPRRREAAAPAPAARPKLMPCGRRIIR
jgi:hypothetical protein